MLYLLVFLFLFAATHGTLYFDDLPIFAIRFRFDSQKYNFQRDITIHDDVNSKIQNIITVFKIFVFSRSKSSDMRIITKTTIKEYIDRNPKSRIALLDWVKKTEQAEWHNFSDIRKTFNSVDYVGNQHYVFNIKGNDYRLVVVIQFTPQHVYIRFIGTHAEYDNIKNIKNL